MMQLDIQMNLGMNLLISYSVSYATIFRETRFLYATKVIQYANGVTPIAGSIRRLVRYTNARYAVILCQAQPLVFSIVRGTVKQ